MQKRCRLSRQHPPIIAHDTRAHNSCHCKKTQDCARIRAQRPSTYAALAGPKRPSVKRRCSLVFTLSCQPPQPVSLCVAPSPARPGPAHKTGSICPPQTARPTASRSAVRRCCGTQQIQDQGRCMRWGGGLTSLSTPASGMLKSRAGLTFLSHGDGAQKLLCGSNIGVKIIRERGLGLGGLTRRPVRDAPWTPGEKSALDPWRSTLDQ